MTPADAAPEPGAAPPDDPDRTAPAASRRGSRVPAWAGWALVLVAAAAVAVFLVVAADWPSDPYLVETAPVTGPSTEATDPPGASPSGRTSPVQGLAETGAILTSVSGESVELCLLVAESDAERERGLMGVEDLGGYDGMLFRFPEDTRAGFWMRDTLLPLTVAFFDGDGEFVSSADMEPCPDGGDCPVHRPEGAYRQAVEVEAGRSAALGLGPGTMLSAGHACPPAG